MFDFNDSKIDIDIDPLHDEFMAFQNSKEPVRQEYGHHVICKFVAAQPISTYIAPSLVPRTTFNEVKQLQTLIENELFKKVGATLQERYKEVQKK